MSHVFSNNIIAIKKEVEVDLVNPISNDLKNDSSVRQVTTKLSSMSIPDKQQDQDKEIKLLGYIPPKRKLSKESETQSRNDKNIDIMINNTTARLRSETVYFQINLTQKDLQQRRQTRASKLHSSQQKNGKTNRILQAKKLLESNVRLPSYKSRSVKVARKARKPVRRKIID